MMFHDFGDGGGFTSCAFFDMLQYLSSNLPQDPLQALPGVVILEIGWGEEAAGDERAWLHGCKGVAGNGWGERAWKSRWGWASLAAWTAADGVGAREWLEMGGRKGMENGCLSAGYVCI